MKREAKKGHITTVQAHSRKQARLTHLRTVEDWWSGPSTRGASWDSWEVDRPRGSVGFSRQVWYFLPGGGVVGNFLSPELKYNYQINTPYYNTEYHV